MNTEGSMSPMPRYKSHKTVYALQIATVETREASFADGVLLDLTFVDKVFAPRTVAQEGTKPFPKPGWYMVQYESGYISFCPQDEFEKGNTLEVPLPDKRTLPNCTSFPQSDIDNWFSYHAPTPEQIVVYGQIRAAARIFAETVNRHVPAGADKTAAMRKIREATMAANAAIACYVEPRGPEIGEEMARQKTLAELSEAIVRNSSQGMCPQTAEDIAKNTAGNQRALSQSEIDAMKCRNHVTSDPA